MIVGLALDLGGVAQRVDALIDGENATLCLDPDETTLQDYQARARAASRSLRASDKFRSRPALTADGTSVAVCINIADPSEVETLDPASCDGIGLVRTEFLFSGRSGCRTKRANIALIGGWPNGRQASR